jgi:hypothetical protein
VLDKFTSLEAYRIGDSIGQEEQSVIQIYSDASDMAIG